MKAGIINISTEVYKGVEQDTISPIIKRTIGKVGFDTIVMKTLPQDQEIITKILEMMSEQGLVDMILTIGATGIGQYDYVPEATRSVLDRELPGIPEAIRFYNMRYTKRTMLNRSVAGVRNNTFILNLPGSKKSAIECLEYVLPEIVYAVEVITGQVKDTERN